MQFLFIPIGGACRIYRAARRPVLLWSIDAATTRPGTMRAGLAAEPGAAGSSPPPLERHIAHR